MTCNLTHYGHNPTSDCDPDETWYLCTMTHRHRVVTYRYFYTYSIGFQHHNGQKSLQSELDSAQSLCHDFQYNYHVCVGNKKLIQSIESFTIQLHDRAISSWAINKWQVKSLTLHWYVIISKRLCSVVFTRLHNPGSHWHLWAGQAPHGNKTKGSLYALHIVPSTKMT